MHALLLFKYAALFSSLSITWQQESYNLFLNSFPSQHAIGSHQEIKSISVIFEIIRMLSVNH